VSGYFDEFREGYESVDDEFDVDQLLEETGLSSRRVDQILTVFEKHEVVEEEDDLYIKNGYSTEQIERDLEILREQER
jgi:cobalamin biosynthesis protein CbiG